MEGGGAMDAKPLGQKQISGFPRNPGVYKACWAMKYSKWTKLYYLYTYIFVVVILMQGEWLCRHDFHH